MHTTCACVAVGTAVWNGIVWLFNHIEALSVIAVGVFAYLTWHRERGDKRNREAAARGFISVTAFGLRRQFLSWLAEADSSQRTSVKAFVESKEGGHYDVAERRVVELCERAPAVSADEGRVVAKVAVLFYEAADAMREAAREPDNRLAEMALDPARDLLRQGTDLLEKVIDSTILAEQRALQPPDGVPAARWFARVALGTTKPEQK